MIQGFLFQAVRVGPSRRRFSNIERAGLRYSVLIEACEVTGSEPPVPESFTSSFALAQISFEYIRAFQPKHAELLGIKTLARNRIPNLSGLTGH